MIKKEEIQTFKLAFLGCRVNQYELQAYREQFITLGFKELLTWDERPAELCLINTCSVTNKAEASSRSYIRKLALQNSLAKIIITGCSLDLKKEFTGDRFIFISNEDKERLISIIFPEERVFELSIHSFEGHSRAFLKVQDGCNSFCSYCIIPYLRGRSRSKSFEKILSEAKQIVSQGYKEIVITGINVGDYKDKNKSLSDVVKALEPIEGLERIRISSIDPEDITEDFFNVVSASKKICRSMHLVLQSGSDKVLSLMNRKYTSEKFLSVVSNFRKIDPLFSLSTDVIIGFPGENEEDFQKTLDIVREVQFSKVHIFPYSQRKRTKAFNFVNQVPEKTKVKRKEVLFTKANNAAFLWRNLFVNKTLTVLTESKEENLIVGHTEHFIKVYSDSQVNKNQMIKVKIVGNNEKGLIGQEL